MYFILEEYCDWERETWRFYIPIARNKDAVKYLRGRFENMGEEYFKIVGEWMPENEVDILVKHTFSGYMDQHNKLKGKINLERLKEFNDEDLEGDLYKGGIEKFLK